MSQDLASLMSSDSEEEIIVYASLGDDLETEEFKNINILGVHSKNPVALIDDTVFTGKYENPLGTYMFFKDAPPQEDADPVFDNVAEKNLEYLCKTRKLIKLEHAYITPNDTKHSTESKCEQRIKVEPATFKTYEDAMEYFKRYWDVSSSAKGKAREKNKSS